MAAIHGATEAPKATVRSLNTTCELAVLSTLQKKAADMEYQYMYQWIYKVCFAQVQLTYLTLNSFGQFQLSHHNRELEASLNIRDSEFDRDEAIEKYRSLEAKLKDKKRKAHEKRVKEKEKNLKNNRNQRRKGMCSVSSKSYFSFIIPLVVRPKATCRSILCPGSQRTKAEQNRRWTDSGRNQIQIWDSRRSQVPQGLHFVSQMPIYWGNWKGKHW